MRKQFQRWSTIVFCIYILATHDWSGGLVSIMGDITLFLTGGIFAAHLICEANDKEEKKEHEEE